MFLSFTIRLRYLRKYHSQLGIFAEIRFIIEKFINSPPLVLIIFNLNWFGTELKLVLVWFVWSLMYILYEVISQKEYHLI